MWESLKTATPAIHAPMQATKYARDPESMTRAVLAPKKTAKTKANQRIFRIGKQLDELKGAEFRKWQKGGQKGPMPRNRYINAQGYYTPEAQRLVDERKRLKKQRDEAEGKRKKVRARERPKPKTGGGLGSGLNGGLGGGL
jgi:hypothetical protein